MKEPLAIRIGSFALLLSAGFMLLTGSVWRRQVLPDPSTKPPARPPLSLPSFVTAPLITTPEPAQAAPAVATAQSISDFDLVRNATFTGVTRRDGQLYLTYDPAQKRGKQSCPT